MCLIVIAHRAHPRYPLVVAANRDEFYERPSARAHFWPDVPELLAGRDRRAGGTWLGITRAGRFAAVTNYRDPHGHRPDARTRGALVSGYLGGDAPPGEYLRELAGHAQEYNGFSLLVGELSELWFYSNRAPADEPAEGAQRLAPGLYGLSNHLLDTPWPKVERGKAALQRYLEHDMLSVDDLLELLADRAPASDPELPHTGVTEAWERALSPIFVRTERYGTRCSTALLVDRERRAVLKEQNFDPHGEPTSAAAYEFEIDRP